MRLSELCVAMAACVLLAACQLKTGGAPVTTEPAPVSAAAPATWAPLVQAAWADIKADAALWAETHPNDAALISKTEADLNPEIAALSTDQSLATASGAVADLQSHLAALPAGVISKQTQGELAAAVAALQLGVLVKQELAP